jgi:hypothetical protein
MHNGRKSMIIYKDGHFYLSSLRDPHDDWHAFLVKYGLFK